MRTMTFGGKAMNRYGTGTLLYRATILYALLALLYDTILVAAFCDRLVPEHLGYPLGAVLCGLGLAVYALGILAVYRAIDERRLATRGVFALVRHPLYAAWVWCIVPGVALMHGTPLVLTTPVVAAVFSRLCIDHEEAQLVERFGEAYQRYRERVGGLFPRLGLGARS
jgi:protein-S-isoprenylcysteine O-methyltransferase Ste14